MRKAFLSFTMFLCITWLNAQIVTTDTVAVPQINPYYTQSKDSIVKAPPTADYSYNSNVNFGIGMGIDYGGIGGRLTILPIKQFALFGGVGYALAGLGYNVGGTVRFAPDKQFCPNASVMYGYNAVIKIVNASQYDKLYYGMSLSFGLEMKFKTDKFFNIELVVPFRPKAFTDDYDAIMKMPGIEEKSEPLPIAFSFGFHFGI